MPSILGESREHVYLLPEARQIQLLDKDIEK